MTAFEIIVIVLVGVIGYLLGSANSSLIVGKFYGVDVREHGSGNAGATNTLRTMGKSAALFATIGDILKGIIACLIGRLIAGELGLMTAGIAAILGHNWPVYFKFKGGKGVLTSLAVVIMMDRKLALILLVSFIIIVALTRYVSLGSVIASSLFPISAVITGKSSEFIVFAIILAELVIIRHCANLDRLFKGTESKFRKKKQLAN